jgi:tetratricopeptide (TPR) repeat protein
LAHSLKRLARYDEELKARTHLIDLTSENDNIKDRHECQRQDTVHWNAYLERSATFRALGRFQESLDDVKMAMELMPVSERTAIMTLFNRACSYVGLKQLQSALDDFHEILYGTPTHRQADLERVRLSLYISL